MLRNGGTDVTIQVLFNWYIDMSVMKISRRGKSKATYIHEPFTCFTYKKKTLYNSISIWIFTILLE